MKHSTAESFEGVDPRVQRDVQGIRERLHHLARSLDDLVSPIEPPEVAATSGVAGASRVRAILKARRARDRFFDAALFADPAWDILLELYEAELSQFRMSVTGLCAGAAVPPTTALRWIRSLEQRGLIQRRADPHDGRRVFVSLSPDALQRMEHLMNRVPAGEPML